MSDNGDENYGYDAPADDGGGYDDYGGNDYEGNEDAGNNYGGNDDGGIDYGGNDEYNQNDVYSVDTGYDDPPQTYEADGGPYEQNYDAHQFEDINEDEEEKEVEAEEEEEVEGDADEDHDQQDGDYDDQQEEDAAEYGNEVEPEELPEEGEEHHDEGHADGDYGNDVREPEPEEVDAVVELAKSGNLEALEDAPPMAPAPSSDGAVQHVSMFKGLMDGFSGGEFSDIVGNLHSLTGGGGGMLTNMISSGGVSSVVENMIAGAAHKFLGIDGDTGRMIGAIAGNVIFNMGGQHNSLGGIGKVILDNLISGRFHRPVTPWVNPVSPGGPTGSFGLDFQQERARCLQEHRLFEDPEFPAGDRAIYYKERPDVDIVWMRPGEIVSNPLLLEEGHSRFDVKQGGLGDCWFLAAASNLTLRDELFYRVVPPDQSFVENYAGIFHFQFWRYGKWVDVVIDDRLPTVDGQLYYMHSASKNEFWSALLEKAYAKMYGSYENLEGGQTCEALEDFTGGLSESFDLEKADKAAILAMLVRGFQMGSLFGCSIHADPNEKEAPLTNGLIRGHAYSVTGIHTVNLSSGPTVLLRIRNPWGNSKEWNGPWSDGDSQWNEVSDEDKQAMGVQFAKDGEFWMSFDDFMTNFQELEVCNLSAEVMDEISKMTGVNTSDARTWVEVAEDGEWSSQQGTAGGCQNNKSTFWRNPKFASLLTVPSNAVEDDGKCTVIVAVLQKYRRELRVRGEDSLPIGFNIFEAPDASTPLDQQFFQSHKAVARVPIYSCARQVSIRFRVPPGEYVIVPSTFEPNEDAQFLMRVFSNGQLQTKRIA